MPLSPFAPARRRAFGLLIGIALLSTGCALHHAPPPVDPPVRVKAGPCYWLQTGTACDPGSMLPETFCQCSAEL